MVKICCVPGCRRKNQGGITMFNFPSKDSSRKQKWIDFVKDRSYHEECKSSEYANWQPSAHSVICMYHFSEEYLIISLTPENAKTMRGNRHNSPVLKKDSVPNLHGVVNNVNVESPKKKENLVPIKKTPTKQHYEKRKCCVFGCKNDQNVTSVLKFPEDDTLRQKWINFVIKSGSDSIKNPPLNWQGICRHHFQKNCIPLKLQNKAKAGIRIKFRLKPGSIPTIFEVTHINSKNGSKYNSALSSCNDSYEETIPETIENSDDLIEKDHSDNEVITVGYVDSENIFNDHFEDEAGIEKSADDEDDLHHIPIKTLRGRPKVQPISLKKSGKNSRGKKYSVHSKKAFSKLHCPPKRKCCVFGCGKSQNSIPVLKFPEDKSLRQQWMNFVLKSGSKLILEEGSSKWFGICRNHFEEKCIPVKILHQESVGDRIKFKVLPRSIPTILDVIKDYCKDTNVNSPVKKKYKCIDYSKIEHKKHIINNILTIDDSSSFSLVKNSNSISANDNNPSSLFKDSSLDSSYNVSSSKNKNGKFDLDYKSNVKKFDDENSKPISKNSTADVILIESRDSFYNKNESFCDTEFCDDYEDTAIIDDEDNIDDVTNDFPIDEENKNNYSNTLSYQSPVRAPVPDINQLKSLFSLEDITVNLPDLNPFLLCGVCKGYFIGATTITECLHTFCKSCLVRHVTYNLQCPTCGTLIHPSNPYQNMKPDSILQDIIYKILPSMEADEKKREEKFYLDRNLPYPPVKAEPEPPKSAPVSPVKAKGLPDWISIQLECAGISPSCGSHATLEKKFIRIPELVTVAHIIKFLAFKLSVQKFNQVSIFVDAYMLHPSFTMREIQTAFFEDDPCDIILLHYGIIPKRDYFKDNTFESLEIQTSISIDVDEA